MVDWKEFLSKLSQKEDYLSMFSIGIDIYQGKMNALLNIPTEEENRKKLVGDFLRDEISKYVIFSTGTKKSGAFDSQEDQNLIKDMNINIQQLWNLTKCSLKIVEKFYYIYIQNLK